MNSRQTALSPDSDRPMRPGPGWPAKIAVTFAWATIVAAALCTPRLWLVSDPADFVTRQTARVAVLFWALAAGAMLLRRRSWARFLWALACIAYWIHVATAFEKVHDWSHAAAFEHVDSVSGFGPGIFVSYAFSLLWIVDVCWWYVSPTTYESRSVWLDRAIHGFMAFVVFNGTIVYETGFVRWAGIVVFTILALLLLSRILTKFDAGRPIRSQVRQ